MTQRSPAVSQRQPVSSRSHRAKRRKVHGYQVGYQVGCQEAEHRKVRRGDVERGDVGRGEHGR